jgi:hypothetical protein
MDEDVVDLMYIMFRYSLTIMFISRGQFHIKIDCGGCFTQNGLKSW